tara:strand:+ start:1691 stop:2407 length:717 start_codon:yes stop_codon:yes gene_type:complete
MPLGLGASLSRAGIVTPGVVTDGLIMKHMYPAGAVQKLSDGSAYFDGNNDYFYSSIPETVWEGNFSISMWIYKIETGTDSLVDCVDSNNDGIQLFYNSDTKLVLSLNSTDLTASTASSTNEWIHVAAVQDDDNNDQQLYINGAKAVADGSADVAVDVGSSQATYFGTRTDGSSQDFKGYMTNVGIWNISLTQPQIKSIMFKQYSDLTSTESSGLQAWYALDTNANDSVGNYNGTTNGF